MTQGVLIFAYNSDKIDYLSMAAWSAKNIHRHLALPVAVATDITAIPSHYDFDTVVFDNPGTPGSRAFQDIDGPVNWYNGNRMNAHALSPWDTTLVLDADYIVASSQLKLLFESKAEFMSHRLAYDVTNSQPFTDVNWFGAYNMPMWWATVMLFQRSDTAQMIFDCMQMIKQNYQHYRELYKVSSSLYRNDYALSIALNIVYGHSLNCPNIPWNLATLTSAHSLELVDQDCYKVIFKDQTGRQRWIKLQNQDLHAMGKKHLGDIIASTM